MVTLEMMQSTKMTLIMYGWSLGTFLVNGYTREISSNGTPVFLKNVGDKVTLWFTLTQDINNLNGKSALTISEDTNGYDQRGGEKIDSQ